MALHQTRTLRPYQQECFHYLFRCLTTGCKEVVLSGPPGSGKSLMGTYLVERVLNTRQFVSAVVVAPQRQITDAFIYSDDLDILPSPESVPGRVSVLCNIMVRAKQWFQVSKGRRSQFRAHVRAVNPVQRTLVTTQQAVSRWFKEDQTLLPEDLSKCILILDEAHHAAIGNCVGAFTKAWLERGGTVVHMTATPFRRDDDILMGEFAPRYTRTLADHIESGEFAPSNVLIRSCPISMQATSVEQLAGGAMAYASPESSKQIVDLWEKDGHPKAVVIVPPKRSERWANRLMAEFTKRGVHVHNAVKGGVRVTCALKALLRTERLVKVYADSKVEVILACARFNEGTDWPLCSHVYNIGLTHSFGLILQKLGRGLRFKGDIEGYPEQHKNTTVLTFLVPSASSEVFDAFEQQHKDHAFLTACFMADVEIGQGYLGNLPRRFGVKPTGKKRPYEETWEDVVNYIGGDVQQCREATGQMVMAINALQEDGIAKPTTQDVVDFFTVRMGLEGDVLARAKRALAYDMIKRKALAFTVFKTKLNGRIKQMGGFSGDSRIIRDELQGVFDDVVAEFAQEIANTKQTAAVIGHMSQFRGITAKEIAKGLRARFKAPKFTLEQIRVAMFDYLNKNNGVAPISTSGDASPYFGLPAGVVNWTHINDQVIRLTKGMDVA